MQISDLASTNQTSNLGIRDLVRQRIQSLLEQGFGSVTPQSSGYTVKRSTRLAPAIR
jgi:hypothetical protein